MKSFILFFLLTSSVFAHNDPEPEELRDYSDAMVGRAVVEWIRADNVQKACDAKRVSRGKKPYGMKVLGCSFWDVEDNISMCTIITGRKTSMMTIAHEFMHCYLGDYHVGKD